MSDDEDEDVITPRSSRIGFNRISSAQSTKSSPQTSQNIDYLAEKTSKKPTKDFKFLNESEISRCIKLCKEELSSNPSLDGNLEFDQKKEKLSFKRKFNDLIGLLQIVFQNYKSLACSFKFEKDKNGKIKTGMSETMPCIPPFNIDYNSLRRSFSILFNSLSNEILSDEIENTINASVITLCYGIKMALSKGKLNDEELEEILHALLVVHELPLLEDPKYIDKCGKNFYSIISELPVNSAAKIVRLWATWNSEELKIYLNKLQQYITVYAISQNLDEQSQSNNDEDETSSQKNSLHKSEAISGAVACLKLIYYASILGGRLDPSEQIEKERDLEKEEISFLETSLSQEESNIYSDPLHTLNYNVDPLEKALNIRPIDCRDPKIPSDLFINEIVNNYIDIQHDYVEYIQQIQTIQQQKQYNISSKTKKHTLAFLANPFILDLAKKKLGLFYDNKIKMMRERRFNMVMSILEGSIPTPYFKMRLQRNNLLVDALSLIELQEQENASILRKQLFIEFENEQGIDQGGVSKEFFQLGIDELLNKGYSEFEI